LERRSGSPAAASWRNSGDAEVLGSSAGLGKPPSGEAKQPRGLLGLVVLRSSGPTARQEGRRGGARGGGAEDPRATQELGLGFRGRGAATCRAAEPHWRAGPGRADRRRSRGAVAHGEEGGGGEEALTRGTSSPEREERKGAACERGNEHRQAGPCGSERERGESGRPMG
jgi:hypothetical protein